MREELLSWEFGPASSRLVRAFLYLFEGVFGGLTLYFGWLLAGADRWVLGVVGALILVAGMVGWFHRDKLRSSFALAETDSRLWREWLAVRRWRWTVAVSLLAGVAFVFGYSQYWWARSVLGFSYFIVFPFFGLAAFLSPRGAIDVETRTLAYTEPGMLTGREREREYDIDTVSGIRRLPLGGRTVLLLSFASHPTGGGRWRLILLPTDVAEAAVPVFERGTTVDGGRSEAVRLSRKTFRIGLVLFLGMGVTLLLAGYLGGIDALLMTVIVALWFGGFALVLFAAEMGFI